ncbi:zinc finger, CCHC-type containing protein [Tanacetum coccineum]|uniref:Zinc finger, CCHC-type containing protein n=1 Tax=Tanacetum coccineum TaxID=301880 RepID=A0ABQ4Y6S5_9ASTR
MINAMLVSANLPKNLWGEALVTACHVSNRIIAKKLKVSPYEIWKGRKPNISYFRVWGCLAYYKVPLPNTSKIGPRGLKSVFVGYAKDSKFYRCLDLDSNVIVESRDVDFFENKFCHDSTSTNEIVTQISQDIFGPNLNSNNKRNMAESSSAPRISERARMERNLDPDFIDSQAIIFPFEGDCYNKYSFLLNVEDAPKTYKEAITYRNSAFWKEAIDDEMDSLFTKDYGVILCLYVDDILIVGTNIEGINETKKFLSSCFQMKDMNEVDTILGIKVKRHSVGYVLNQCHYIDKIIDKFQHLHIEEANTPYESSCKLINPSNPSQYHWKAIGRIFGYLKRTRQLALYYDHFHAVLEGYSDSSWITGSSDSKSTTGWIFTLGGGAVCWGSKKQTCITHSTMEAEFLSLAAAGLHLCGYKEWCRSYKGELLLEISMKLGLAHGHKSATML